MKRIFRKLFPMTLAGLSLVTVFSCNNDDDVVQAEISCTNADYVIANMTGAFPSVTSYIQTLSDLNISDLNTENATEIPKSATIWKYDDTGIYSSGFGAPATLIKYAVDENCVPREKEMMVIPGATTFSSVEFISPTKGYATVGGGLAKVVIFDPSTMRITGEMDLAKAMKPEVNSMFYVGSAVREDKMFLAIAYYRTGAGPAFDSCFVAVIDIQSNTLEKVISDKRTGHILANGPAVSCFAKDSNGDIYVQGLGYSHTGTGRTLPSGILKIKNGETDFDPDYFFDLKEVTGKNCYGLYHFGDGLSFTTRIEDESQFWMAPSCKFYKIDLDNKTTSGELAGVPLTRSSSSSLMRKFNDTSILFNVFAENENAMYEYDIASGTASKKFIMVGSSNGFEMKSSTKQ